MELQAGDTGITARATGSFGGAAVLVAPATGARVTTMGRNGTALHKLKRMLPMPDRFEVIPTREDVMADYEALRRYSQIDTYVDMGPPQTCASTHIKSFHLALRYCRRVSLMGWAPWERRHLACTDNVNIHPCVALSLSLALVG